MFYRQMLLLAFIVAFIVDLSGFVGSTLKPAFNAALHREPDASMKPVDCSLCMCFWSGIALCFFQGFTLEHVAFVCACSYCERFLGEAVFLLNELYGALIDFIMKLIGR